MSLNLTVPKDSPTTKERSKTRRTKSPMRPHPRAKSKSPNPSFCSVLSRVKDWELGAFTPKTALADNVDVMNRSNVPFSDSDRSIRDSRSGSEPWKASPTGSPVRDGGVGGVGIGDGKDATGANGAKANSGLLKSALSSNLGKKIQGNWGKFSFRRVIDIFGRPCLSSFYLELSGQISS